MIKNTPAMGWNTWNTFGRDVNEELVLTAADAMVKSGLHEYGYEYIVLDDCWSLPERDKDGRLQADPAKFPHGMQYVADYIHGKGLKFGMYSCSGVGTCEWYPASYNHEFTDAKTFAEWGVDYLKYDFCMRPRMVSPEVLFRRMGLALAGCGRDILFSGCSWGADGTPRWIGSTGANMWRSTGDIQDNFNSVKSLVKAQYDILPYGGKDCCNDMDMLVVGMNGKGFVGLGGCTPEEYRMHFGVWCVLGSPLMIGCDIRSMDENAKAILTNKVLLDIDQDPRGNRPYMLPFSGGAGACDDAPIIVRHLSNGDLAVALCNFTDNKWRIWIALDDLAIPTLQGKTVEIVNAFEGHNEMYLTNDSLCAYVEAHGAAVARVRVVDKK